MKTLYENTHFSIDVKRVLSQIHPESVGYGILKMRRALYLPIAVQKQPQINAAVAEVLRELSPDVQRIRYEIAPDWTGQWAVFFRVLLSDEASDPVNLREIAPRVVWRISDALDIPSLGMFPYFDFRSQSEQTKFNEPAWA